MYTEGFDELSEAENRPPRTYVSTGGQDSLKLQRENERLKKNLEKEQFFNRLLDQELKDIKNAQENGSGYSTGSYHRRHGVSRSSFNVLLILTIAFAGFIAYTLLYNKQYNLFPQAGKALQALDATPATPLTDSVPNIISGKNTTPPVTQQQNEGVPDRSVAAAEPKPKPKVEKVTPAVQPPVEENLTEPDPIPVQTARTQPASVPSTPARTTTPVQSTPVQSTSVQPAPVQPVPAQPAPVQAAPVERKIVGKYMITSKANFYSAPDGNTLRSYFISPGNDKTVNALEDKNGFIYVEFKNDIGYVTKGWLSKADLTKQ